MNENHTTNEPPVEDLDVLQKSQKHQEKFESLFQSLNEGVCFHEMIYNDSGKPIDYKITNVNPSFESILGLEKEKAIGSLASKLYQLDEPPYLDIYSKVAQTGEPTSFETYYEPMNRHFKIYAFSPAKYQFVTVFSDISEQKQAEEALKKSEKRFQQLSEATFEGVCVHEDGKIVDANKFFTEFLGYEHSEVIGMSPLDFAAPESLELVMKNIASGNEVPIEAIGQKKDGSKFTVEIHGKTIIHEGKETRVVALRDLTESILAKEKLKESEEQFRTLADESPNMIFINKKGNIVYVNKKCEEIMGYTREEFYSPEFDFFSLIVPEYHDLIKEKYSKHLTGGGAFNYEYGLITKSGKNLNSIISSKIINYEGEKAILGIVTDITERKLAERAILESEEKYRDLANLLPQTVFEIDLGGNFSYVNQYAFQFTGYTQEDIDNGLNAIQLFIPEDRERALENISKVLKGEKFDDHEYTILKKDGNTYPVLVYSSPIIQDNKPVGLRGIVLDISDRKRAEVALKESEEKFRTLFESAGEGIMYLDAEGTIIEVNPQTLKIAKIKGEDVIGKNFVELLPLFGLEVEVMLPIFEDLINGGKLPKLEWDIIKDNGTKSTIMAHPSIIKKDDEVIGMSVILDDITERKIAEQKTIEERNRAELYLDILSHDINNLDQAIISSSELLLLKPDLNKDHERYVKNSLQQAKAISDLISNVGKLSELKESDISNNSIDVYDVIENSIDRLYRTHPTRDIEINHNITKSQVFLNGNQLVQDVFDNLLGNAIKYDRHDKAVVDISFSHLENEDYWKLEIKDRGPGIPDVMKEQIFKRLERGEESIRGSGLGLTIVREVIRQCNGKVWVEDRVEKDSTQGSNFVVMLPKIEQ